MCRTTIKGCGNLNNAGLLLIDIGSLERRPLIVDKPKLISLVGDSILKEKILNNICAEEKGGRDEEYLSLRSSRKWSNM